MSSFKQLQPAGFIYYSSHLHPLKPHEGLDFGAVGHPHSPAAWRVLSMSRTDRK
jgi:hypothetical protein